MPVHPGTAPKPDTGSQANFSIRAPAPQDTIVASANGYLSNFTTVSNVTPGQTYNVGTINLTKEGTITALIEGADPTHELVACTVLVSVISRSSLTLGANVTVGNGHLNNLPVPPFPSIVSFDPKCPQYDTNRSWVNVSAYSNFNMGPVYLPGEHPRRGPHVRFDHEALPERRADRDPGLLLREHRKLRTEGAARASPMTRWPGRRPVRPADRLGGRPERGNRHDQRHDDRLRAPLAPGPYLRGTQCLRCPARTDDHRRGAHLHAADHGGEGTLEVGDRLVVVSPTSMDGYTQWSNYNPMTRNFTTGGSPTSCIGVNANSELYAPPLRDSVTVTPEYGRHVLPAAPTWPIPTYLPVFGNESIVNVTPNNNFYSPMGWVNLTPGTYVEGGIYGPNSAPVNGQSLIPISATTTDQNGPLAAPSWPTYVTAQPAPPNHPGFDPPDVRRFLEHLLRSRHRSGLPNDRYRYFDPEFHLDRHSAGLLHRVTDAHAIVRYRSARPGQHRTGRL